MHGGMRSFRNEILTQFINNALFVEPLNLFLYTWRFLKQLRQEESNKILASVFKWLEKISIIVLPLGIILVYPAFNYIDGVDNYALTHPSSSSNNNLGKY